MEYQNQDQDSRKFLKMVSGLKMLEFQFYNLFIFFFSSFLGNIEIVYPDTKILHLKVNRTNHGLYKCITENDLGRLEKVIQIKYYGNYFNPYSTKV